MVVHREEYPAPTITQFFAGRSVFITGATGFVGKVLVERLLSTCPDIGQLFLLMRSKAGAKPRERLLDLKKTQLFDILREKNPSQLDKLRIITGDIAKPGLALTPASLSELEEVSVVFNCAATVRFLEPLRAAAENNVLSVMRLMELCDRLPQIKSFVHVSTGYSNLERSLIAERVYPPPRALPSMLADALAAPDYTSEEELKRIIHPKPNTYTYTKMLGEAAVAEHGCRNYPVAIFRPTIVISSLRTPFPGWTESHNGPGAAIVSIISGMTHVFRCDVSIRADLLPVDVAVDTLIAVAWETAVDSPSEVKVYNCSTCEHPTTWGDMNAAVIEGGRANPASDLVWYPTCFFAKNRLVYETIKFLVQTVPFHFIEYLMRIFNPQKNRINWIRVHNKLCSLNDVLEYFTTREWSFETDNVRRLRARLSRHDADTFNLDPNSIDWKETHRSFVRGCQLHLKKEKEENLPEARKKLQRMYFIHRAITILIPVLLLYQLISVI